MKTNPVLECILHDTDPYFYYEIRRYACRVFVLLAIPQIDTGRCLDHQHILELIDRGKHTDGVIVNDHMRCGPNEHALMNWAFDILGAPEKSARQVGWDDETIATRPWKYKVAHWLTGTGPEGDGHFTLFDHGGNEIYDPHDPRQAGYEINKIKVIRELTYQVWTTP